jgi:capsular exopolysaccharide synthesis family protein
VRILDRAEAPEEPVRPNPLRNIGLAMLLGGVAGVALAFLLEMLDATVTTREHVEERLGLPFLGIIPTIEREKDDIVRDLFVHAHPQSVAAECLRSIRTNLLFMSPDRPLRTILVTSSGPGEGKTTTATSLAEIMADGGNRVLLVDADMRRPRLHKVFGFTPQHGLSSLILGEGRLGDVVHATGIANLSVLTCGSVPPNPAELLHAQGFKGILAEASEKFDRVIIDSPPAGVVADAVVVSTHVDGTLLVLKARETSRDAAMRTIRALGDVNARIFGAVLNDLDLEDGRYGQYYSQYYQYGYHSETKDESPTAATLA